MNVRTTSLTLVNILASNKKSIFEKDSVKSILLVWGKTWTFVTRAVIGGVTKQSLKKKKEPRIASYPDTIGKRRL